MKMDNYRKKISFARTIRTTLHLMTMTTMVQSLNMSPLENSLLGSRLEDIRASIMKDYSSSFLSSSSPPLQRMPSTFIFPGAGGVDDLVTELQSVTPNSKIIDWKSYRGSILTAAYDGEAVGEAIAELILANCAESSNYDNQQTGSCNFHFIGISVGAFCANAAATTTFLATNQKNKDKNGNIGGGKVTIQLTLLDPFCGRGVLGSNYGQQHFGKYVSSTTPALQIMNTDDPVPTTNEALQNCICLDVTKSPLRDDFIVPDGDSMHSWPLAYYSRHFDKGQFALDGMKPGTVITVQ